MAEPDDDPRRFFPVTLVAAQALAAINQHVNGGNLRAALGELAELIRVFPTYAPAYNTLGWLYANPLESPREALPCYRRALELDPDYPPVYFNLIVTLNTLGFVHEVPALVERALKVPGMDPGKIHHQHGTMFELQRDYARAAVCYREAIAATLSVAEMDAFQNALRRCQAKASLEPDVT